MTERNYYRPLALVYGSDARQLISVGRAGCLAGHDAIGFTQVEVIRRGGRKTSRAVTPFEELGGEPAHLLTRQRGNFAGLAMDRSHIMGIVNVTPDSFSDGGLWADAERAISQGEVLVQEGAAILDIGGESTRPGSDPVADAEEIARVVPVIRALSSQGHLISSDTRKTTVMTAAVAVGARIINDVSALSYDEKSLAFVAEKKLPVVLMHALGDPKTMQQNPQYQDVVLDVYDALAARIDVCREAGIALSDIAIDPGIGFGKTLEHNIALMQQMTLFHGLGVALLIGLSRKAMVGALTGEKLPINRVSGSLGGALFAAQMGAHIIRVHDVKPTVQALNVLTKLSYGL